MRKLMAVGSMVVLVAALAAMPADAAKKKKGKCRKADRSLEYGAKGKKKKGCKKPKVVPPTTPALPPAGPTVRVTLTWNSTSDLDLFVWDQNGNRVRASSPANPIPSTTISADDANGFGPETFTDLIAPSTRQFTYGICLAGGAVAGTVGTLTYTRADGFQSTASTTPGQLNVLGSTAKLTDLGSPPAYDPPPGWCTPG